MSACNAVYPGSGAVCEASNTNTHANHVGWVDGRRYIWANENFAAPPKKVTKARMQEMARTLRDQS